VAGPRHTVLAASADWQLFERDRPMYGGTYDWYTLEGPTVRLHDGVYYCIYSGGSWHGTGYAVAWAEAAHPLGPWHEPTSHAVAPDVTPGSRSAVASDVTVDNRLLATVPGHVWGPGHNSVVTTREGAEMLVYHAWDEPGTRRQMCIDPLIWADGPRTPGPSWDEQPLPS
jgi:arabinan endo-1,5-alpha-L-arabinosidase